MGYLQKNVNAFLLLLVVAIVMVIAGLSTYYQRTYENLSENYEGKLEEINRVLGELNIQRVKLNETASELTLKEQREQQLSGQYVLLKKDRDRLDADLREKINLLEQARKELEETRRTLKQTAYQLEQEKGRITELQGQVAKLEDEVKQRKAAVSACQSDLAACRGGRS